MTSSTASTTEKRSYFDQNVCRLCSAARDKVLPIFDTSGSNFDSKIKECFPSVKVSPADGKPQQICLECITKLNIHYEFLQLCLRSNMYFDSYIRTSKIKELEIAEQTCKINQNGQHQSSENLIVLSKVDESLSESIQDLVVVVELKYKEGNQAAVSETITSPDPTSMKTNEWNDGKSTINQQVLELSGQALQDQKEVTISNGETQITPVLFRFDPEKKVYDCSLCDKTFKKRTRLNSHLACHKDIRPYKCNQCGKSFAMKCDLNTHARGHKKDVICLRCDKGFSTKSKLERHFRVHTGVKPFSCTFCSANFSDKRNLDNHMRTHTGDKPFSCSLCSKTFSVKSHMKEHLNVHKKFASYFCSHCNKLFRWRANYKKHLKTHSTSGVG